MTRTSERAPHRLLGERIAPAPHRRGFTLIELLAVILILGILLALLLPAINGAMRTAKNAAVGGEINQLAQALNAFKTKYGDYPPSRIYLAENGDYSVVTNATALSTGDITLGQLAQRSLSILRKFFPRAVFSTTPGQPVFVPTAGVYTRWYDFNGNGQYDAPYILQGHECLVFFLGGIPKPTATGFGMSGFGKDPTNPFTNSIVGNTMYSGNRQTPFFEFAGNRLLPDPNRIVPGANPTAFNRQVFVPGYLDSLGNAVPVNAGDPANFYAYFSAYGNSGYDPNDMNVAESDVAGNGPVGLVYHVSFPVTGGCGSPGPNPYTSSPSAPATGLPAFINTQTFQLISPGLDGLYGVGGQYQPDNTVESLFFDSTSSVYYNGAAWVADTDTTLRYRERDNVTNFHNGRLE